MRTTAAALVAIGLAAPAEAARVNLSRLDREAWECAVWVYARSPGGRFRYQVTPNRNGTVGVESWGRGDETATFHRCLRDKGNVMERVPEAVLRRQEMAADRAYCRGVGPGDLNWAGCLRTYGRRGVRQLALTEAECRPLHPVV